MVLKHIYSIQRGISHYCTSLHSSPSHLLFCNDVTWVLAWCGWGICENVQLGLRTHDYLVSTLWSLHWLLTKEERSISAQSWRVQCDTECHDKVTMTRTCSLLTSCGEPEGAYVGCWEKWLTPCEPLHTTISARQDVATDATLAWWLWSKKLLSH